MRSIHQQRGQGSRGEAKYLGNWRWSSSLLPNLLKYVASFHAEGNTRQIVIIETKESKKNKFLLDISILSLHSV